MNSNNEFSHNKMLSQHKPCSFNDPPDNLATSPRMSDDSSEETCTILQWRNKCQKEARNKAVFYGSVEYHTHTYD